MKKILITCTDMMMIQFLVPHVRNLAENGFEVEIACSVVGDRIGDVRDALSGTVKAIHTLRLERSPVSPRNILGYGDMKRLLARNHYDIIWTNEPVMGVVTRLAANRYRKRGTKVVYMCHGFHFFKGAGIGSWMVFYPIERLLSRCCDMIVTINREDEARAKTFHYPRVEHIDGIGVDFSRLQFTVSREQKRQELGVKDTDVLVLSVGELQRRKNHEVMIRAIANLNNPKVRYFICGRGELHDYLKEMVESLGLRDQVTFLGYRRDIPDILNAADIYAHPSRREGLGLASLEAMAVGLPLITSNIQGIPDYIKNGVTGFMCDPGDDEQFAKYLDLLITDHVLRNGIGQTNLQYVRKYAAAEIQPVIVKLLESMVLEE